jgi:spore photoproduct lyase
MQCSLDCTYCILQAYLNQPNLRIFGNTEDIFAELTEQLRLHPNKLFRIGTGEFTDSLLLDRWTRLSTMLAPLFALQPNAVLELKTKTDFISHLKDLDHNGHTIVAWSLNAPSICRTEESGAATLKQRIKAARLACDWGYKLAFHFDPMIEHVEWRKGYGETLDRLFSEIDAAQIVWVSLGAFRFMPELKSIIQERHPQSRIICGEFIRGLDGKMRYFRDIRADMYAFMVQRIRKIDPDLCVYLCMEGRDMWQQVFGYSPDEHGGLSTMLDLAVKTRMKVGLHCTDSHTPQG